MFKRLKNKFKKLLIATGLLATTIATAFTITNTYAYDYNSSNNTLFNNNIITDITSYFNDNGILYENNTYTITDNKISISLDTFTSAGSGTSNRKGFILNSNSYVNNGKYTIALVYDFTNVTAFNLSTGIEVTGNSINSNGNIACPLNNYGNFYGNKMILTYNIQKTTNQNIYLKFATSTNTLVTNAGTLDIYCFIFESNFNPNYVINNNQTFYAYSSIEQLQQDYEELQTQYNDYVSNHSHTNTEYNDMVSYINYLTNEIDNLRIQYNLYVATHSYTDTEYETLQNQYNTLNTNYQTLQAKYEALQNVYNRLIETMDYGWLSNVEYFQIYGSNSAPRRDLQWLITNEVVMYNYLDLQKFAELENVNGQTIRCDIEFKENSQMAKNFEFKVSPDIEPTASMYYGVKQGNQTYTGPTILFNDYQIFSYKNVLREIYGITTTNENYPDYLANPEYDNVYITGITFEDINPDSQIYDYGIEIIDTLDSKSYQKGYTNGTNSMQRAYREMYEELEKARNDISVLGQEIITQRQIIQGLREQNVDSLGWQSLFFAMADTPIKVVSNVLGFEIFGLNLFHTFIGMVTVFGIVVLLKKFI